MEPIVLLEPATLDNFHEVGYLAYNTDVADAVLAGDFASGQDHYLRNGKNETRFQYRRLAVERSAKAARIAAILRRSHDVRVVDHGFGPVFDSLTTEKRDQFNVETTDRVSSNNYDDISLNLIESHTHGLVLDCGAGHRDVYYPNVVNFEIVEYPSTDVLGVAEELPFEDESFEAVLSIAVLEHVLDPRRAANEIIRVLKPGGTLYVAVPFLQPLHGYPNHYFNMTHEGLRSLFTELSVIKQQVLPSTGPIWSLTWIIDAWANGLTGDAKEAFLSLPLREFLGDTEPHLTKTYVTELSEQKNFELASATTLLAQKR